MTFLRITNRPPSYLPFERKAYDAAHERNSVVQPMAGKNVPGKHRTG